MIITGLYYLDSEAFAWHHYVINQRMWKIMVEIQARFTEPKMKELKNLVGRLRLIDDTFLKKSWRTVGYKKDRGTGEHKT